jgi:hypothetical protein
MCLNNTFPCVNLLNEKGSRLKNHQKMKRESYPMNLRSVFNVFFLLVIMLSSCKEDEMEDIQIMANAGPVQNVKLNDLVTLNGSASSGPEGKTYFYSY